MAMDPIRIRSLVAAGVLLGVAALSYSALRSGSPPASAPSPRIAPAAADAAGLAKPAADVAVATGDAASGPAIQPAERSLPGTWVDVAAPPGPAAPGGVPVVIALHGRGDTAEHFSALAARMGGRFSWRFLQAPLPFADGRAWYRAMQADGGRADMEAALAYVDAHVGAAGEPVALLGFSQGCYVAAHYAASHPDSAVRAVLCIGGSLLATPLFKPVAKGPAQAAPRQAALLFVHATDDAVVPLEAAKAAVKKFLDNGRSAELLEHSEGHTVPESEIERMRAWLERNLN